MGSKNEKWWRVSTDGIWEAQSFGVDSPVDLLFLALKHNPLTMEFEARDEPFPGVKIVTTADVLGVTTNAT